jgi:orotidine-5'-phosphate decarboxylase
VICALDTTDFEEASRWVRRLSPHVGAFKIGHGLVLGHGLDVIRRLQDVGAPRIFLDLKFHDIPNAVAIAVCQAARRDVWMLTVHTAGGPGMLHAAVEEAKNAPIEPPIVVGVSVLTSLDQHILGEHLGVQRTVEEHMVYLSKLAVDCGLDGVVCSAPEIAAVRESIGRCPLIVTPGIRLGGADPDDQRRVGTAQQAIADGADFLVIGRPLTSAPDPAEALAQFELAHA